MHNPTMTVTEAEFKDYTNVMIALLKDVMVKWKPTDDFEIAIKQVNKVKLRFSKVIEMSLLKGKVIF